MAGRKSTRSSSHKSAAPSRAAPAPKTAAPPATTHQAAAPAQATPAPVIIHQTGGGGGGGFLSGVAQMAAGHVAGRVAYDTFFGGNKEAAPVAAPLEAASPMGSASQLSQSTSPAMCEPFLKQFMRCMDANFNEVSACQSIMDQLKACRGEPSQGSTSFAGGY